MHFMLQIIPFFESSRVFIHQNVKYRVTKWEIKNKKCVCIAQGVPRLKDGFGSTAE